MSTKLALLRSPLFKFLIKRGFTDSILGLYWGKNKESKWKKIEESGCISKPKSIWFEPTMRCNLNCQFCHQNERRKLSKTEMSIKQIDRFFSEAKKWGVNFIEMIGGEIFVRKDIFQILDLIEEKKMKAKLGTNGILSENVIEKIKEYNCIESIAISLDGPEEIHNKFRNSPLAYQKAVESLKRLSQNKFIIGIYSVLSPQNLETSEFLIRLAKELKADRLTFMPEMFYSHKDVIATQEYLDLDPQDRLFVEVKEMQNLEEYAEKVIYAVNQIKKIRRQEGVFTPVFPRISYKYPDEFFNNSIGQNKKLICKHFHSFTVIENGDVLICPFIHRKVGNVLEEDLQSIWNNKIMGYLRQKILRANLLPICQRCCAIDYL
ncbi:MAG: radical SAM protein [Candidatus Omnitrophica bacterium]|nr:radical SAM protein [Candidatus Omnitrophota bacterium]MBU1133611.1 radical SAM protein [Candidatus Omnitrophota bacterium]MBU1810386.1 radical SAM protein [Candidatus Omnitrophota bacterium]